MVRPEMVAQFAETHDANMWVCLARLIGAEPSLHAQATDSLQFSLGGLGLTSAVRGCLAAHWASWTDCLAMINNRHPEVGHINVRAFPASRPSRGLMNSSGGTWKFPRGRNLLKGHSQKTTKLWSRVSHAMAGRKRLTYVLRTVWPALDSTDRAMSRSQRGPLAATPFVSLPSNRFSKFDPQSFRLLLRRRLRLPIPLSSRSCRCGRQLDPLGHHRAGCSEAVVLRRGFPFGNGSVP